MKKPISARIEPEILELAEKAMKISHRKFNNLLEVALKEYCENIIRADEITLQS